MSAYLIAFKVLQKFFIHIITMTDSDTNPAFDPRALSPSPAPQPPTASAPGPRASALEKIFNDALSHTLKACSYTNFAACFPTPARYVPESLTALHKEFVMKLEERCKVRASCHVLQYLGQD